MTTDKEQIHKRDWDRETVALLALSSMKGVGYWTLYKMASQGIKFEEVLKASTSFEQFEGYLNQVGSRVPKTEEKTWEVFQRELWSEGNRLYKELKFADVKVRHFDEPSFPEKLKGIQEPPRWLFIQGDESLLRKKSIAIVGTRKPTEDGIFLANYIGACVSYFDTVTVSGLAYGIDQIIHQQSIRFNVPTIAVLGTGIFLDYPAGSEVPRKGILSHNGAIITEYLPHQSYSAQNFVRRNRLQAGLSEIVIPAQWKAKSGTSHTVRYAVEGDKKVFCLRLPNGNHRQDDWLELADQLKLSIFTIPGEENKLIKAISENIPRILAGSYRATISANKKYDSDLQSSLADQLSLF